MSAVLTLTDEEHALTVHRMAADTLRDMHRQAQAQYEAWKRINPVVAPKALESLSRQVTEMFSMFFGGATRVTRDGDLNLFVSTSSGFVYGVIWHPDHYRVDPPVEGDVSTGTSATRMGRYCVARKDDGAYCGQPIIRDGNRTCECTDCTVMLLPVTGTWSFHS